MPSNISPPSFRLPRMSNQQFDEVERLAHAKNIKLSICPTCGSKRIEVEPDSGIYVWPESTYRLDGKDYPCDCERQIELARHYLLANIPNDYWTLSEDEYFGDPDALAKVQVYLERWPDMFSHGIGMEFYSPTMGTGKTMLATMIAKHLVKSGERVYFTPFRQTVGVFEMPYEARQAIETLLRHVPVLVLDEVVRSSSDAQRAFYAEKLEDLIRYRTSGNAVTIITTNLTSEELNDQYPRAFSLLAASAQQVFVNGEDARRAGEVSMLKLELVMNKESRPIS